MNLLTKAERRERRIAKAARAAAVEIERALIRDRFAEEDRRFAEVIDRCKALEASARERLIEGGIL